MRRIFAIVIPMIVGLLVPIAFLSPPASATCAPVGKTNIYRFKDRSTVFTPTNLKSQWVYAPDGGSITYDQTTTKEVNASMTAEVSAEASAIFASASATFGVSVGGGYSKSEAWSYQLKVPADSKNRYRLHQYHYSLTFKVMKKHWSTRSCDYKNAWGTWQLVRHAPEKSENRSVWRLDKSPV